MINEESPTLDFNSIRLKVASPDGILQWSHGEVIKPETINYRTQKPEKDGLFAEEIFGPSKDWECYCGKYKRIRYKGIVCDKCGVEVTRSIVRRERMGHIKLASPVSHIWFLRGVPSKIGLVLDLSPQDLERVIYFASFIITHVDEGLKTQVLAQIDSEGTSKRKQIASEFEHTHQDLGNRIAQSAGKEDQIKQLTAERDGLLAARKQREGNLDEAIALARRELKELKPLKIISESTYRDLSLKYGHVFEAGIGAEAVRHLLERIDMAAESKKIEVDLIDAPTNKKRKLVRRLRLFGNLMQNGIRPEWMILTVLPVIPPDLRPMVQLDGGRFATSDLNDLYRRVINRNNRLKRLVELNAPEVICRNEKRMLQEAVDALIDNAARHGKTVTASTGQKRMLRSIADMLKGKQGRFRQNLLGKRVDYSGRSVIVVGPHLSLGQCGLPKRMALELFKPFVMSELIKRELVHNVRSASRYIEAGKGEVWDILEEITNKSHVLLNRAPTLHRLGIQAFTPILIEGKAIQVHPMVCPAFNADFDGDQMAVHVPLTERAKWEAANIMLSTKNLLKPATGEPVVTPSQDIVLGCFYMTQLRKPGDPKLIKQFASPEEAVITYQLGATALQEQVMVPIGGELTETTPGRILFNRVLPAGLGFVNKVMDKKALREVVSHALEVVGAEQTVLLLDNLKALGIEYLTKSGLSWGMDDLSVPAEKPATIAAADRAIEEIQSHYDEGLLTDEERSKKIIEVWERTKEAITTFSRSSLDPYGPVYSMIESGARGSLAQLTQMMGMKGLVTNPAGEIIELPVKGSFKEGFEILEYFISTHGARKGLSDTALRTASAGYLTRRLIDVSQDVIIVEADCGDTEGIVYTKAERDEAGDTLGDAVKGRFSLETVKDAKGTVIVKKNQLIDDRLAKKVTAAGVESVRTRSVLGCTTHRGLCQRCYGWDLGFNRLVEPGVAVGIIAAQSIGEPGTQLTMRTFHTGGVAGLDITQGLPRVEELFEARPIKKPAVLAEEDGDVEIVEENKSKVVKLSYTHVYHDRYPLRQREGQPGVKVLVKDGDTVERGQGLIAVGSREERAKNGGLVSRTDTEVVVAGEEERVREYAVPVGFSVWVKTGDRVSRGEQLTEGNCDLHQLYRFRGRQATQKYVVKEIEYIYSSQGQKLNGKHIEIIVRQMFSRVYIRESGSTDLIAGEIVTQSEVEEANRQALVAKGQRATYEHLLLGITKASLSTDSFLSAASFQETARVLIDAAVSGRVDYLRGLKENVIIGKLVPAGTGFRSRSGVPAESADAA